MTIFSSIFGMDQNIKYSDFWKWFVKNQDEYFKNDFKVIKTREKLFDDLNERLASINPDLTFEFGPKSDIREFIISADGNKKAFQDVTGLVNASPTVTNWKFIPFRQRKYPVLSIVINELKLDPKDINYSLAKDGDKIGMLIYYKGLNEKNIISVKNGMYILLDGALGEYDMETKVGFIEIVDRDDSKYAKYYDENNKVSELASHFDDAYKRISK